MDSKPLLYGLIGFFLGGLIVSIAATTFDKPDNNSSMSSSSSNMSMEEMTARLENKKGDRFEEAFITSMIEHHDGAIEMAKLAESNARHDEIKELSKEIISAQEREIEQMVQWQKDWGYKPVSSKAHPSH